MFSWLVDAIESADASAAEDPADDGKSIDWSRCPAISYDELAALLVPAYTKELHRRDGWGHPFEFCVNRDHLGASRYVVGVRSPGRDGRWEGDGYPIGRFEPEDVDRDLVWLDGFFITWPEAVPGGRAEGEPTAAERSAWRSDS